LRNAASNGFTVIELLVVLALVAGLTGVAVMGIGSLTSSDLRNEAMRMTSVMKYTWTQAAINNTQYRMVLDLDSNEYSVQVTDSPVAPPVQEQEGDEGLLPEEAMELENEQNVEASDPFRDGSSDPFGIYRPPSYETVQNAVFKGRKLKEDLTFHEVWTVGSETPIREGKVAVGFFPDGFQQQVIIILTDGEDNYYSVANEPLTGRVKIYSDRIEPDEAFGEPAEVQD
jgi:prepilin-type N-terminal cleavage/methylation domain-containing protein